MKPITLFSTIVVILCIAACKKKQTEPGIITVDSMELHRVDGFSGRTDHYRLNFGLLMKGQATGGASNKILYNVRMPMSKYNAVRGLLTHVPADMLTDNIPPPSTPPPGYADYGWANWVVFYKGYQKYTYHITDHSVFPDYYTRLDNAWAILDM